MGAAESAAADRDPLDYAHYRVLKRPDGMPWKLGAGSMGVTFKALDRRLQTVVALKLIQPFRDLDARAIQLFVREARAAARILHPNVAPVLFLSDAPGRIFYAMEFVDGVSLHEWLQRHGTLEPPMALAFAGQIAAGLAAIHEQQIVHRDLKPGNVMVTQFPPGHPRYEALRSTDGCLLKIIDFGLARAISEDLAASREGPLTAGFHGTVIYASPEQCREDRNIDGRSDLYSLGCILWEMLGRRPPFEGETHFEQLNLHLNAPLPLEKLGPQPAPLLDLLERMLAKRPEDRFQTARELGLALEDCARQIARGTRSVQRRSARFRRGWLVAAGAAAALTLPTLGVLWFRSGTPNGPAPKVNPARQAEARRLFDRGFEVENDITAGTPDYLRAAELYDQAFKVDPTFAEAAARLALTQAQAHWQGLDKSPIRLVQAQQAAEAAVRLNPNLAVARLASGDLLYRDKQDFARALREFEFAIEAEPTNAEAWYFSALVARRLGRWDDALRRFQRTMALGTANEHARGEWIGTLALLRRWPEMEAACLREGVLLKDYRAEHAFARAHRTASWRPIVEYARTIEDVVQAELRMTYEFEAGLLPEAIASANRCVGFPSADTEPHRVPALVRGFARRGLGEHAAARADFSQLLTELEPALSDDRREVENWTKAALARAALGQSAQAAEAAQRALQLLPLERDAVRGAAVATAAARAYAVNGQMALAYPLLEQMLSVPSELTTLALRHSPAWTELRANPGFPAWIEKMERR